MSLITHLKRSLDRAVTDQSKVPENWLQNAQYARKNVGCMSGPPVRRFLNNLAELEDLNYLEIGTHTGSTFCPAVYGNTGNFTAIDNFQLSPNKDLTHEVLKENLELLRNEPNHPANFQFLHADCWELSLDEIHQPVNVYFYDGAHGKKAQKDALTRFKPILANEFIFVVDDFTDRNGRLCLPSNAAVGTSEALKTGGFEVLYQATVLANYQLEGAMDSPDEVYPPVYQFPTVPTEQFNMGLGVFVLRKGP